MSGLSTHGAMAWADLGTDRGHNAATLASIDGIPTSSEAPSTITVADAGSAAVNGTYDVAGTINSRLYYAKGTLRVAFVTGQWRLDDYAGGGWTITTHLYQNSSAATVVPKTGWVKDSGGSAMEPAPTISY